MEKTLKLILESMERPVSKERDSFMLRTFKEEFSLMENDFTPFIKMVEQNYSEENLYFEMTIRYLVENLEVDDELFYEFVSEGIRLSDAVREILDKSDKIYERINSIVFKQVSPRIASFIYEENQKFLKERMYY